MIKRVLIIAASIFCAVFSYSQESDFSAMYGRFWSFYKSTDYGTGFKKAPESNYNFYPALNLNKYVSHNFSIEFALQFTDYQQYYSTKRMKAAYNSNQLVGHAGARFCYSYIKQKRMEGRIKLGFSLGITGSDKWEYFVVSYNPVRDSITRGVEYRNYTPVFPMLTTGTDLTFWVSGVLGMSLGLNYQKGFIKIIEQDIYYNDGSGFNDQRAKQWGTGDFIGLQFGVRYKLKKRKTE